MDTREVADDLSHLMGPDMAPEVYPGGSLRIGDGQHTSHEEEDLEHGFQVYDLRSLLVA